MSGQDVLYLYLIFLFVQVFVELSLVLLNLSHIKCNSTAVPAVFRSSIDEVTYQRSVAYSLAKGRLALFQLGYGAVTLCLFAVAGWYGIIEQWVAAAGWPALMTGVCYVLAISLVFTIINLPISWYATFVLEDRFGFNRMTKRLWLSDLLKQLVLSSVLLALLAFGLLWFMDRAGTTWWIYAAALVVCFQLLVLYVYPTFIAPLFNNFEPLPEGSLREQIMALAIRLGFKTAGIYVMDGSRRSNHGNAYFTGVGKAKRIVLFDTLVKELSEKEIVAVLAHEIGHQLRHHVTKMLVLSALFVLVGFWIMGQLSQFDVLFEAFGFSNPSWHALLVLFTFAAGPVLYFFTPLMSVISRRFEYQADRFAVDAVDGWGDLRSALIALSRSNLSNLTPHPWYSFFHYSHPTITERLEAFCDSSGLSQGE